jgi:hypothetical protein
MWVMLLGTMLLLVCSRLAEADNVEGSLLTAGGIAGLGFWVHQLFVVYLAPLLLILALRHRVWRHPVFHQPNRAAVFVGAVAVLYMVLAAIAFFTAGIEFRLGSIAISATAPQKLLRIAIAVAGIAVLLQVAARARVQQIRLTAARYWPVAAGFLLGYLPVLLYSLIVEPARAPSRVANLRQLIQATPDIFGNIVPILSGFKIATTERLDLPWIAALPGAIAIGAYVWQTRGRIGKEFFPTFVVFAPAVFLAGGVYLDTLSYRYLIPWYAGLAVAWAAGSRACGQKIGIVVLSAIVAVHGWQQWLWYQKLQPDTESVATIECLKRNGIRGGYAEYWTSFKLTFLAKEEVIIAPTDGVDRYPRYTEFVKSLPDAARAHDAAACGSRLQAPPSGPGARGLKPNVR